MKRICPKCNNLLKDSDNYFCASCGLKLDDYLILHSTTFKPKRTKFIPVKKKVKIEFTFTKNVKIALVILLGFIFISSLAVYLTNFMAKEKKKLVNVLTKTERVEYKNTVDLKLPLNNVVFGAKDLTKFVPEGIDFYIESVNFEALSQKFYGGIITDSLFKNIFDITLDDRFVVYGKKVDNTWRYVVVAEVSSDEAQALEVKYVLSEAKEVITEDGTADTEQVVDEAPPASPAFSKVTLTKDQYTLELVENVVIITDYKDFIKEIAESSIGAAKNITHNQKYSSFSAYLPPDGQFVFMNFTQNFGDLYELMLSLNPSEETIKMLNELKLKKLDKFVIRNNE